MLTSKGEPGEPGSNGPNGEQGRDGRDGYPGRDTETYSFKGEPGSNGLNEMPVPLDYQEETGVREKKEREDFQGCKLKARGHMNL